MGGGNQITGGKPPTFGKLHWCKSPTWVLRNIGEMHVFSDNFM